MNFKSKGEEKFYNLLIHYLPSNEDLKIIYEFPLAKIGCLRNLRTDFMITNKWGQPLCAFEIDGEQHYNDEQIQERDEYKNHFLDQNLIKYYHIPWINGHFRFQDNIELINMATINMEYEEWYYEEEIIPNILYDLWDESKDPLPSLEERKKQEELKRKMFTAYFRERFNVDNNKNS